MEKKGDKKERESNRERKKGFTCHLVADEVCAFVHCSNQLIVECLVSVSMSFTMGDRQACLSCEPEVMDHAAS